MGSSAGDGEVAGKVRQKFFSGSRGDLMEAEDSEDESGVAGVGTVAKP